MKGRGREELVLEVSELVSVFEERTVGVFLDEKEDHVEGSLYS